MLYVIRYCRAGIRETEAQVEAHSPSEAMVKFRCTAGADSTGSVTSVRAEGDGVGDFLEAVCS